MVGSSTAKRGLGTGAKGEAADGEGLLESSVARDADSFEPLRVGLMAESKGLLLQKRGSGYADNRGQNSRIGDEEEKRRVQELTADDERLEIASALSIAAKPGLIP